jgi:hypothetical protein
MGEFFNIYENGTEKVIIRCRTLPSECFWEYGFPRILHLSSYGHFRALSESKLNNVLLEVHLPSKSVELLLGSRWDYISQAFLDSRWDYMAEF